MMNNDIEEKNSVLTNENGDNEGSKVQQHDLAKTRTVVFEI
jgi:hypothetical protein